MSNRLKSAAATLALLCLMLPCQAQDGPKQPIPDLTKGEKLTRMNSRWAGPVGIYCGMWRPVRGDKMEDVRQLLVLEVDKGSPADGVLEVDDVILGADGTGALKVPLFEGSEIWPMIPIAEAITDAEARNPALLKLLVWRKGVTKTVPIELEYLGRYSETAPYDCPKSKAILKKGIDALLKEEKGDAAGFGVLCLLAAAHPDDPRHDAMMAKAKEWAHALEDGGSPWYVGPKLMALSEYYMKSKDQSIFPKLEALAEYHASKVSWFGTCGHRYSEPRPDGSPNGHIAGYGPVNASGTLGYLGLSLARKAGVKSEVVEKSHKAKKIFFGHYAFKVGIPYGEHAYGIADGLGDYNGKCAMSALAFALEDGQENKSKFFASKSALSSDLVRGYAHGGPFFGQVFHPLGANLIGPESANLQFREIQWHLDLKRRWDHTRIFDARSNPYSDFSYAATAMLFYAAPLKQLVITGRDKNPALELSKTEFRELVIAKEFDPKLGTDEQLLAAIPSCQGFLRDSIAKELSRRILEKPEAPESATLIDQLLSAALDEQALTLARVGSCAVLMNVMKRMPEPLKTTKSDQVAAGMVSLLQHDTAYIRFAAVRVLEKVDPSLVRKHVDAIMEAIVAIERPTFPLNEEDPLQWSHGIMSQMLVEHVLKDKLDGIDRSKLIPAVRSMLRTPSGHSRTASTHILDKLNKEETLAVSDLLIDNIETPPPADSMFGRAAGPNCQDVLAKHRFEEGLLLGLAKTPDHAIKAKIPQQYGKAGLEARSARELMQLVGDLLLGQGRDVKDLVKAMSEGELEELPSLKQIESVKAAEPTLKLPEAQTSLVVNATNFADLSESGTNYTWRKLYGPGKVSFTPNGSSAGKSTKVAFTDKKPGAYMFEVTMSDALGPVVVRETVGVTLLDPSGKLPSNRPPQAGNQTLQAVPGKPLEVNLPAGDPDGDALGFVVTQLPAHGLLTDANGNMVDAMAAFDSPLFYTAGYSGKSADQLTFLAMDGQGKTAKGAVDFTISSKDVGVVVYEPFDYAEGPIHGAGGGDSFGFSSPWEVSNEDERYKVVRAPIEGSNAGASISYAGMPHSGGRLIGQMHRDASRMLDRKAMDDHKLLNPGGELWFSIFMEKPEVTMELAGPDLSIGFGNESRSGKMFIKLNGKEAGESRNTWGGKVANMYESSGPDMVVGHCVWGETDQDPDLIEIHRVYDSPLYGPILIEKPVAVLKEAIDQQSIHKLRVHLRSEGGLDELRIGSSLNSVMLGTKPLK